MASYTGSCIGLDNPAAQHEQIVLNVIKGKRALFVYPYILLLACFTLCIMFTVIAALVPVMTIEFGDAQPGDIGAFLKIIFTFNFGSNALKSVDGAQADALAAATGIAAAVALLVLSAVFGTSIRILKRRSICQKAVFALLSPKKGGFVPCDDGIYKQCIRYARAKTKVYCFFPWESLSLCVVKDSQRRIVLKAGKLHMALDAPDTGSFERLKDIVSGHLPVDKGNAPVKKGVYRWGRAVIVLIAVFILWAVFSGWFDNALQKGPGAEYCDVGGKIHYTFRTAFEMETYYFEMQGGRDQTVHKFCELHGVVYVMLHPAAYVPTIKTLSRQIELTPSPVYRVMLLEAVVLPAIVWLYAILSSILAGRPRMMRFCRL